MDEYLSNCLKDICHLCQGKEKTTVVDALIFLCLKSRFPPEGKQQKWAILNAIDSFRAKFSLIHKNSLCLEFLARQIHLKTLFQILNFGKIQISSVKSFITSATEMFIKFRHIFRVFFALHSWPNPAKFEHKFTLHRHY